MPSLAAKRQGRRAPNNRNDRACAMRGSIQVLADAGYDRPKLDMARPAHTDASEELLEAMPDAIVMVGRDGRVVRVNKRAESLSGYSRRELVGMAVEELVPEMLRSAHVAHRAAYQRRPTVRSMGTHLDIRFRRKDGSEFPADIALSPVMTEQVAVVVASVRDITDRKRAEEELLQAQERFRLVVEGVHDYAIFMLDREGHVSTWSPAAARIKGYEADEVLSRHFSIFYPKADVDAGKPERELATAAEAGRYEEEGWRVRKDGSRFWASVVITAIRDPAGKLLGFGKITRDITERKRQDDRIRAALEVAQATLEGRGEEELLQLIAERARALVEADHGLVMLDDAGPDTLFVAAADGPRAAAIRGNRVPSPGSQAAQVLASGRALVIDDAFGIAADSGSVFAALNVGPAVMVRLASRQRGFGGVAVPLSWGREPLATDGASPVRSRANTTVRPCLRIEAASSLTPAPVEGKQCACSAAQEAGTCLRKCCSLWTGLRTPPRRCPWPRTLRRSRMARCWSSTPASTWWPGAEATSWRTRPTPMGSSSESRPMWRRPASRCPGGSSPRSRDGRPKRSSMPRRARVRT